jgi:transposase-like protein
MQANLRQLKKRRRFTDEFKKEIVSIFESGKLSVLQLQKLYGIHGTVIYRWIYKFSTFNEKGCRIVEMSVSSHNKLKELEAKVKQLEQIVGQKQIAIDYLEKMIELAGSEFNIDVKKNYNTQPSIGSKSIKKK